MHRLGLEFPGTLNVPRVVSSQVARSRVRDYHPTPTPRQATFTVRVHPDWAPEGAKRFQDFFFFFWVGRGGGKGRDIAHTPAKLRTSLNPEP